MQLTATENVDVKIVKHLERESAYSYSSDDEIIRIGFPACPK